MKLLHGIYLKHDKNTNDNKTLQLELPKNVKIPMLQCMGASCIPLVNIGDTVLVGEKIGETDAFMSSPVHSSVSGKVTAVEDILLISGNVCKCVCIETDGLQKMSPEVKPPVIENKADFIKAVRESGICGLGGAGFPTHIKLNFDENKTPVDTLVINAAECEPYITSDFRELMENPNDIKNGIETLMSTLKIPSAKLCIERNKPSAIEKMTELFAENANVEIITLPSRFPQGAEKIITYSATGRIVKEGELPSNSGVLVINVSTVSFISRYLSTGIPLISRRITIDGDAISNPCNVEVPIGTPISQLLTYAKADSYKKILAGGPMMGTCIYDIESPVIKTHNAIIALKDNSFKNPTSCIRCGKCIHACPMKLMPTELEKAYKSSDIDKLRSLKVGLCMNCGCCSYVCPTGRPLAETNQLAKIMISRK